MFPSWERIVYFHFEPAMLDGLLALAGVLCMFHIFRVRDPSVRSLFLFIPLVRPLLILLEGAADLERQHLSTGMLLGLRIPDPFHMLPVDVVGQERMSTTGATVAVLIGAALILAVFFLAMRWAGFVIFFHRLKQSRGGFDKQEKERVSSQVGALSKKMKLSQAPALLFLAGAGWFTPCAIGWRRPALVIDTEMTRMLDDQELEAVLAHELAHFARKDGLWHWAAVLLGDIQSFSPISHLSRSRIELEREKACDRIAVSSGQVAPRLLASCLVKQSRLDSGNLKPLPSFGMGLLKKRNYRLLQDRVKFLLTIGEKEADKKTMRLLARARFAWLLLLWLPLSVVQLYACAWIGNFALVVK